MDHKFQNSCGYYGCFECLEFVPSMDLMKNKNKNKNKG